MTTHPLQLFRLPTSVPTSAPHADMFSLKPLTRQVLLVTNVVDDSGSINACGNTQAIIRGYNEGLDNFTADQVHNPQRELFVSALLINRGWLYQAKAPGEADRLNDQNYRPDGSTPLFPATLAALDFVTQAATFLTQQGLEVYSFTNILTDGADTTHQAPSVVAPAVRAIQLGGNHIVTGIAVRDGQTNFFQVFTEMGILEQWIKVIERQEGDIVTGVSAAVATAARTDTTSRGTWRMTTRGFNSDGK